MAEKVKKYFFYIKILSKISEQISKISYTSSDKKNRVKNPPTDYKIVKNISHNEHATSRDLSNNRSRF